MQIRRVLLLFALVLGLSALVASIAPPPEEDEEAPEPEPTVSTALVQPAIAPVRLSPRTHGIRRVETGSSFSLKVSVREPGDVVIDDLGLRQTADPLSPARFDLLASPAGRHAVVFVPLRGRRRVIGRLAFVEPATVTPRRPDR